MKAPDKLYIPIIEEDGKKLLCTNWWETDTSSRNAYVNETIPYIRKDALIEWAKETYLNENASAIRKVCFKQLVEKLMSM